MKLSACEAQEHFCRSKKGYLLLFLKVFTNADNRSVSKVRQQPAFRRQRRRQKNKMQQVPSAFQGPETGGCAESGQDYKTGQGQHFCRRGRQDIRLEPRAEFSEK